MRPRIRLGSSFAFSLSLILHASALTMFIGGTSPGAPDGRNQVAVDIITQEQLDLLMGNGSSQGGIPPKVETADYGLEPSQQTPLPPKPEKTEADVEQRQAPKIVAGAESIDVMPVGNGDRVDAAASKAPRKADKKSETKGSLKDSMPTRVAEPKDRPDAPREDARNELDPTPRTPGSDGGQMRRIASQGGVGESRGPLPPSMRQSMMQLIRKQIELCYVPPSVTADYVSLPLVLIRLSRQGALDGMPKALRFEHTTAGKAIVQAALKAVRQCAPYKLPPRFAPYYEDWKEIKAEFEFSSK